MDIGYPIKFITSLDHSIAICNFVNPAKTLIGDVFPVCDRRGPGFVIWNAPVSFHITGKMPYIVRVFGVIRSTIFP